MTASPRHTREIKRIRNEILVALKVAYPTAVQARQLLRILIPLFPTLEFDHLKRDLHYLVTKSYLERVVSEAESDAVLTPWRNRWFRLSARGMELADRCIQDPALEE